MKPATPTPRDRTRTPAAKRAAIERKQIRKINPKG